MGEKIKILIVDDEEGMRETLAELFSSKGYAVKSASNGIETAALIKNEFFNVVLLDVRLPDMDGVDVLRMIKKESPDTEVVLMTAYASIQSAIKALNEGAYAYIMKPFEFEILIKTVKDATTTQSLIIENRELRNFNENIVQSLKEGIIVEDEKGIISFINPMAENMLGYKKEEILGRRFENFFDPEYKDLLNKRMTGGKERYEAALVTKSGKSIPLLISTIPLSYDVKSKNYLSVLTEISDIKSLEKELKEKIAELEHFNKLMVGRELRMLELKNKIKELENMQKGKT